MGNPHGRVPDYRYSFHECLRPSRRQAHDGSSRLKAGHGSELVYHRRVVRLGANGDGKLLVRGDQVVGTATGPTGTNSKASLNHATPMPAYDAIPVAGRHERQLDN